MRWLTRILGRRAPAHRSAGGFAPVRIVSGSAPILAAAHEAPRMKSRRQGSGQHRQLAAEALDTLSGVTASQVFSPDELAVLDAYRNGQTLSEMPAPTSGDFRALKAQG